jgi:hypothetical protein
MRGPSGAKIHQMLWNPAQRKDQVHRPRCNSVSGHGIILGFRRFLGDGKPPVFFDLPDDRGCHRSPSRSNNTNGELFMGFGKGSQEMIDRRTFPALRFEIRQAQVRINGI